MKSIMNGKNPQPMRHVVLLTEWIFIWANQEMFIIDNNGITVFKIFIWGGISSDIRLEI